MSDETPVGHTKGDSTDVYIGRGPGGRHMENTDVGDRGWLGNPYPTEEHGGVHSREESIRLFRVAFSVRLAEDAEFRSAVLELHGQTLGCWCRTVDSDSPPCHGDVIAAAADRLHEVTADE